MKRLLFIGHEATRTGAPIVLLHFLRWAKANRPDWKIDLLLLRGGELEEAYREVAEVFVAPAMGSTTFARGLRLVKSRLGVSEIKRSLPPFRRTYDAVVGNTVVALPHLGHFQNRKIPTICWIHELEAIVASFYSDDEFAKLAQLADRFIVPSKAVEEFVRGRGVRQDLTLVYEFSEAAVDDGSGVQSLDLPAGAFVVLGSGTIEWRKGVDLFLAVAQRVVSQLPDAYFVWVGGEVRPRHNSDSDRILYDLKHMGLSDRVIFTGKLANPHGVFQRADLFALTSREDPFPLVCIEAASMAKPIICFAGAGGIPELVEDDSGAVVPYGDSVAFAEKIVQFYHDRDSLDKAGAAIKNKIETRFSLNASCEKIARLLQDVTT